MTDIKIALLGLGTVGSGVVKVLLSHGAEMQERAGCRLVLHRIAEADMRRPREGLDLSRLPWWPTPTRPSTTRRSRSSSS